jgi:ATP-dependent DNA ligase
VQFCAFDILAEGGDDLRMLPLSTRKANLERLLAHRPEGVFINPFERGELGPDLFRAACNMGLRDWCRNAATGLIRRAGPSIGSR